MFPFQVFRELQPTLAGGFKNLGQVIRSLFANGEQGVWYDPSDFSTLFQDSAGTTPVTAVEQPVGLMLDKSQGLVLGPELVTNGGFDSGLTGWFVGSATSATVVSGEAQVTFGGTLLTTANNWFALNRSYVAGTYYEVYFDATYVSGGGLQVGASYTANLTVTSSANGGVKTRYRALVCGTHSTGSGPVSFGATSAGSVWKLDNVSVRELPGNHASQPTATSRPVLSARVNQYLSTETLATQNVTTLAAQYRLSFEGTGAITLSGTATGVYSAGSHLITCTAGTLTSTVSGSVTKADLRVANTGAGLPAYQRVNTATDYDTVGFPHYLRFDGVDDWLVTPTITPGADKVQAFAGVGKLSDAATTTLVELSLAADANSGSFFIRAPTAAQANYQFLSRGTLNASTTPTPYAAPQTDVLTCLSDIAGDRNTFRINGAQVSNSIADQGTGNFLAYPLYIGRRGGTTLPLNGHLYSLIVRFGANLPTATIEKTEKYINQKTRAY